MAFDIKKPVLMPAGMDLIIKVWLRMSGRRRPWGKL